MLDLIRLLAGSIILVYASYSDFKYRKVGNKLWLVMGALGVLLLGFSEWDPLIVVSIGVILIIALIIAVFNIFGGADVKALVTLSILAPLWPHIDTLPLYPSLMPFPLSIFINSLILFLVFPLYFSLYNIVKRDLDFPQLFLGYRITAKKARKKFVWPMETIKQGERTKKAFPVKNQNLEEFGNSIIWVTPKIPFMVPLLFGFISSFLVGDILFMVLANFI